MANFDCDKLSTAFGLTDEQLIALLATANPWGNDITIIFAQQGATTGATDETWGIAEV